MRKFRTNIYLIPTTLDYLSSSVVGVVKVDYFDFPCEIFEILGELDVTSDGHKYTTTKNTIDVNSKHRIFLTR